MMKIVLIVILAVNTLLVVSSVDAISDNGNCGTTSSSSSISFASSSSSSEQTNVDKPVRTAECSEDETLQLLLRGNAVFTGKSLYEVHQLFPNKSLIISPFSVFVPMGQLALYAQDDTYTQLMNVLNLRTKDDIRCAFPALARRLQAEQNVTLNLAAKIFASDVQPLSQNFIDDTKDVFDAEAESVDFTKSSEAADKINQWVANKTNNRIQNLVPSDSFDSNTRLVLANAIYFLGNWVNQFDATETLNRDFYVNNETTIQIPTMYQMGNFYYSNVDDLDCKVLELFYKGGNFSFVVFLPNQIDGLSQLILKLQDADIMFNAYNSTTETKVAVYLPKIKTESEIDLKVIMQKANIKDLFDQSLAKLDGILEQYEQLYVSVAKQKAFVEVDEKGTEAAAANFVQAVTYSAPAIFNANRPFVFYIFHTKTPIFCGTFQPSQ